MKKIVGSLITVMLVAISGHASTKRYLVVMRDSADFKAAQTAFNHRSEFQTGLSLKSDLFNLPGAQVALLQAKLEESLKNLNTIVVQVDDSQEKFLRMNPGVAYVEEEIFHPAPRPVNGYGLMGTSTKVLYPPVRRLSLRAFQATSKTPWGILAVKAMDAWGSSQGGLGSRVMILDTGIDKDHPALAPNFEKGQDFVGDNQTPYAFADTIGHGTHVAGTIAAVTDASGFTGVAPQSKILAGRVCSAQGCSNIAIARGVNWGLAENVDVISMSLGGAWSTPAERDAITKATAQGITVVAASGNDGTNRISYPAALPEVIAVGAVDQNNRKAAFSQYGPELAIVAPGVEVVSTVPQGTGRESDVQVNVSATGAQRLTSVTFEGAADVPAPLENTMVYAGLGRPEDFAAADVRGKFALMARGEIKFIDKVQNAINAGAVGAIIFNNAPGLIHGALTQDGTKMSVPVFMIEQVPGESLRAALNANQEVKARVAVIATDYAPLDGTSMATPHVTGVVALIKAANRNLTPAQVKQILQKTALKLTPNDNNEFGAGMINAMAATGAAVQARNAPALP